MRRLLTPVEVAVRALGSVKAVSLACGVTHGAVSQWRRSGLIPAAHLQPLLDKCRAYGVTAEELINGRVILDTKTPRPA